MRESGRDRGEREREDREGKRREAETKAERQSEGWRAGAGERDYLVSAGSVCLGFYLALHVSTPKRRTVPSCVTHAHDAHEHAESHLVESGCARLWGYLSGCHKGLAPVHFYKRACLGKEIKDNLHHAHTRT